MSTFYSFGSNVKQKVRNEPKTLKNRKKYPHIHEPSFCAPTRRLKNDHFTFLAFSVKLMNFSSHPFDVGLA